MKSVIIFVWGIAVIAVFVSLLFLLGGCNVLQPQESKPVLDPINPATQIIWKTIQSTDWISSLFILAIAGGVFVGLNGLKSGWLASLAAFVGLIVKAGMSSVYVYWMCGLLFIGVVVLILVSVFIKNRAIKELICGIQKNKDGLGVARETVNGTLAREQSKETRNLVLDTKAKLKKKGEI